MFNPPPLSSKLSELDHDDMVLVAAQPTDVRAPFVFDLVDNEAQSGLFVGGEHFFNYAALGSLRPDGSAVRIFSCAHLGWIVDVVFAGLAYTWFHYLYVPKFQQSWSPVENPTSNNIMKSIKWVVTLSIVIGMLSDCRPIAGYRRKSYLVIGWLIVFVSSIALVLIDQLAGYSDPAMVTLATVFVLFLWFGLNITWLVAAILSVEYAQRETLEDRGKLQSTFFMLSHGSMTIMMIPVAIVAKPNLKFMLVCSLSLGDIALVLAVMALIAMPFIIFCLQEERVPRKATVQLHRRCKELWNLLSQRAVYSMIFGIAVMIVFACASIYDWGRVMLIWSHFDVTFTEWMIVFMLITHFIVAGIWRFFLINVSWRTIAASVVLFAAGFKAFSSLLIIFNGWRSPVLYVMINVVGHIVISTITLLQVITATEITYLGREGAVIGLFDSTFNIIWLAATAFWPWLQQELGATINATKDTSKDRTRATIAVLTVAALSAASTIMVIVFPVQKLDAQQMRAFGGYHWLPRIAIPILVLTFLVFDLLIDFTKILN